MKRVLAILAIFAMIGLALSLSAQVSQAVGAVRTPTGVVRTPTATATATATPVPSQPFQIQLTPPIDGTGASFTVPSTKRLRIEDVDAFTGGPGTPIYGIFQVQTTVNGNTAMYSFPMMVSPVNTSAIAGAQHQEIFADAGTTVTAFVLVNGSVLPGATETISGFLDPAPSETISGFLNPAP